ncbi:MAG: sigma-54 dependent transcriptional regulator [Eubacteriales bacterium]
MRKNRVLIAEDEENILNLLERLLKKNGYITYGANNGKKALEIAKSNEIDIVITDIRMPEMDGIELIKEIKKMDPCIEVIVMTAFASVDTAIEAVRIGARDYIRKPFDIDEVISAIDKASIQVQHNEDNDIQLLHSEEIMVANSQSMKDLIHLILKVADSNATVNISGETGVGKELVAKAIHENGERVGKPFIQVNCSAFPETLLESELFGYEKGAFTGATESKPGRFELANGGTIFLDEIGDISPTIQLKLLRVIQQREVERLGSTQSIPLDIRVITATNKDLKALVTEKLFREDLYYRLNVIPVAVVPLRDRKEDIQDLIATFMVMASKKNKREKKGFSKEAMEAMLAYAWPGNVRELENVIERLIVVSEGDRIELSDLPEIVYYNMENKTPGILDITKDKIEEKVVKAAISEAHGNVTKAAESIGISRRTLYRKMHKYNILS